MTTKPKAFFDFAVTAAMGLAAVFLIVRTWNAPTQANSPRRQAPPAIEDVTSARLITSLKGAPRLGSNDAPVVLIEYSDFECPFCARHAVGVFRQIEQEYVRAGRIQYAFRNYPIEQLHPSALKAAQVAECAHQQGKFLETRTYLFARQQSLAQMDWGRGAAELGMDTPRLSACLDAAEGSNVSSEKSEGTRLGVTSTPTFFVGKRKGGEDIQIVTRINGAVAWSVFKDGIERVLAVPSSD